MLLVGVNWAVIDHWAVPPPGTFTVVWPDPSTVSPGRVTKSIEML